MPMAHPVPGSWSHQQCEVWGNEKDKGENMIALHGKEDKKAG